MTVLKAQLIGSLTITVATFGVALAMMYAIKAMGILRVSKEGELEGLDVHEHGLPPYPEFVLTPSGTPHGAIHGDVHPTATFATAAPATDGPVP
jgi:Amt family ammonium transporter